MLASIIVPRLGYQPVGTQRRVVYIAAQPPPSCHWPARSAIGFETWPMWHTRARRQRVSISEVGEERVLVGCSGLYLVHLSRFRRLRTNGCFILLRDIGELPRALRLFSASSCSCGHVAGRVSPVPHATSSSITTPILVHQDILPLIVNYLLSADSLVNSLCDILDVVGVQASHADTPVLGHVNVRVFAKPLDLCL
jgi:hypothetical protein